MKKEYIKPEMQVYKLETMQLMAASPEELNLYGDYPDDENDEIL